MQIAIAGTNDFVKKSDEFIVNIALIHKDTPTAFHAHQLNEITKSPIPNIGYIASVTKKNCTLH
jgi:3'-phosphoadenosine 5'-phosphosulfate (PAPS) 3'-phosphatase